MLSLSVPGTVAVAETWTCLSSGGGCEYGFGPRCQAHFVCECPPAGVCVHGSAGAQTTTSCDVDHCTGQLTGKTTSQQICSVSAGSASAAIDVCDGSTDGDLRTCSAGVCGVDAFNQPTPANCNCPSGLPNCTCADTWCAASVEDNETGAPPNGTLCGLSGMSCGAMPAYGSPAVACGSYGYSSGFCTPQAPIFAAGGDAANQPCCDADTECTTSLACNRAYCGADWHCHAEPVAGCCSISGAACPAGQACMTDLGSTTGRCTKACTIDANCGAIADCFQHECVAGTCHVKLDTGGKALKTSADCCRNVRDCADRDCDVCQKAAGAATGTCTATSGCCNNPNDCLQIAAPYAQMICAACVGACAGCQDANAAADGHCQACDQPACKARGTVCAESYVKLPSTCWANGGDACAAANACSKCDKSTGSCVSACDDGNPCTDDSCSGGACVHAANTATCDDHDPCTSSDHCASSSCVGSQNLCDDANAGTKDFCDSTSGAVVCHHLPVCDDLNPCTTDTYSAGTCSHSNATGSCSDLDSCTVMDTCSGGVCGGASGLFTSAFDRIENGTDHADDDAYDVAVQPAGYALVGNSLLSAKVKMWLVRTDLSGAKVCETQPVFDGGDYSATSEGRGIAVIPASASTYPSDLAVVGWKTPTGSTVGSQAALAILDSSGTTAMMGKTICDVPSFPLYTGPFLFDNTYGAANVDDKFVAVVAVSDGLMIAGTTSTFPWLFKADFAGGKLFSHVDGTAPTGGTGEADTADQYVTVEDMAVLTGGKVVMAGFTNDSPAKAWLAAFDPAAPTTPGARVWRTTLPGSVTQQFHSVAATPDGGILAVGQSMRHDSYGDFLVVRFNSAGSSIWNNVYGNVTVGSTNYAETAYGVTVFSDGSFLAVGNDTVQTRAVGVRGGSDGQQLWAKTWAEMSDPYALKFRGIAAVGTSSAVLVGTDDHSSTNSRDFRMMTVDVGGNHTCSASGGCYGQAPAMAANVCQNNVCSGGTWTASNNTGPCFDGDPCKVDDRCNGSGSCVAGTQNAGSGMLCSDGNICTMGDACNGSGICVAGQPATGAVCSTNPCLIQTCNGSGVCGSPTSGTTCDDGNPCTTGEFCTNNVCGGGKEVLLHYDDASCGANATCAGTRCMVHP